MHQTLDGGCTDGGGWGSTLEKMETLEMGPMAAVGPKFSKWGPIWEQWLRLVNNRSATESLFL